MDEKLKHLSIAKKLRYSFGCVLLATSVIFVAAIISLGTVLVQFRSFYATPDFCRKLSIKYPPSPVITRIGGFVILSDFYSVF